MVWYFLRQFLLAGIASICFGALRSTPWSAAIPIALIGGLDWIFYVVIYYKLHLGLAVCNLLAALGISVASFYAARHYRLPMIVFNVPALAALVPGGQAYKVVRYFVMGHYDLTLFYLYQVVVICGAITIGYGLGDVVNRMLFYRHKKLRQNR
jgi:uncharacterized membrane protein YjjB (DUF3815 family)